MATNYYLNTSEDTIDGDELTLYNLIMDYRGTLGLSTIPLSAGLTATAGRHVLEPFTTPAPMRGIRGATHPIAAPLQAPTPICGMHPAA